MGIEDQNGSKADRVSLSGIHMDAPIKLTTTGRWVRSSIQWASNEVSNHSMLIVNNSNALVHLSQDANATPGFLISSPMGPLEQKAFWWHHITKSITCWLNLDVLLGLAWDVLSGEDLNLPRRTLRSSPVSLVTLLYSTSPVELPPWMSFTQQEPTWIVGISNKKNNRMQYFTGDSNDSLITG